MPVPSRKNLPLLAAVVLLLAAIAIVVLVTRERGTDPDPDPNPHLSALGEDPDWPDLHRYDGVLTRAAFEKALREVYLLDANQQHWRLTDEAVTIEARGLPDGQVVRFAADGAESSPPRYWRPAAELPPARPGKPLDSLRIAIDPGHLGGDYARMEERWYQIGNGKPVTEGDMTLKTAHLLKPLLENLGATVTLVRKDTEPITDTRPADYRRLAKVKYPDADKEEQHRAAERLFYRTAEIRARARKVNEKIRPDLVLCLHYNTEGWGDPRVPALTTVNHFHMILNGAYMDGEVAHEDERFEMMHKIFQGIHAEEAPLAAEAARAFMSETGLPAYFYAVGKPAIPVGPALWARNLLANRLYQCPVLFFEPYVMNNEDVYQRVQVGDYEGEREVAGKLRISLYREYANAVVTGLVNYYKPRRKSTP